MHNLNKVNSFSNFKSVEKDQVSEEQDHNDCVNKFLVKGSPLFLLLLLTNMQGHTVYLG